MDAIDAMADSSHKQYIFHHAWRDVSFACIKIFIAYLIIMGLLHKSRLTPLGQHTTLPKHLSLVNT